MSFEYTQPELFQIRQDINPQVGFESFSSDSEYSEVDSTPLEDTHIQKRTSRVLRCRSSKARTPSEESEEMIQARTPESSDDEAGFPKTSVRILKKTSPFKNELPSLSVNRTPESSRSDSPNPVARKVFKISHGSPHVQRSVRSTPRGPKPPPPTKNPIHSSPSSQSPYSSPSSRKCRSRGRGGPRSRGRGYKINERLESSHFERSPFVVPELRNGIFQTKRPSDSPYPPQIKRSRPSHSRSCSSSSGLDILPSPHKEESDISEDSSGFDRISTSPEYERSLPHEKLYRSYEMAKCQSCSRNADCHIFSNGRSLCKCCLNFFQDLKCDVEDCERIGVRTLKGARYCVRCYPIREEPKHPPYPESTIPSKPFSEPLCPIQLRGTCCFNTNLKKWLECWLKFDPPKPLYRDVKANSGIGRKLQEPLCTLKLPKCVNAPTPKRSTIVKEVRKTPLAIDKSRSFDTSLEQKHGEKSTPPNSEEIDLDAELTVELLEEAKREQEGMLATSGILEPIDSDDELEDKDVDSFPTCSSPSFANECSTPEADFEGDFITERDNTSQSETEIQLQTEKASNGEESDLERIALAFSNNNKFEEVSKTRGKGTGRCELNIEWQHAGKKVSKPHGKETRGWELSAEWQYGFLDEFATNFSPGRIRSNSQEYWFRLDACEKTERMKPGASVRFRLHKEGISVFATAIQILKVKLWPPVLSETTNILEEYPVGDLDYLTKVNMQKHISGSGNCTLNKIAVIQRAKIVSEYDDDVLCCRHIGIDFETSEVDPVELFSTLIAPMVTCTLNEGQGHFLFGVQQQSQICYGVRLDSTQRDLISHYVDDTMAINGIGQQYYESNWIRVCNERGVFFRNLWILAIQVEPGNMGGTFAFQGRIYYPPEFDSTDDEEEESCDITRQGIPAEFPCK